MSIIFVLWDELIPQYQKRIQRLMALDNTPTPTDIQRGINIILEALIDIHQRLSDIEGEEVGVRRQK